MIKLTAPDGMKLRDIRNNRLYSEVITDERLKDKFVVDESEGDVIEEAIEGVTLSDRVSDLEDAVVELAEIITEEEVEE